MKPPHTRYKPEAVNRHVTTVPMLGTRRFGHEEYDFGEYPLRIVMARPKEIVALRDIRGKVPNWDYMEGLLRRLGVEQIHIMPIKDNKIFTEEGSSALATASEILERNVRSGRDVALTCNQGHRRTKGALYLLHRRMGASHDEGLREIWHPELGHPFNGIEQKNLRRLFEEHMKMKR